MNFKVKLPPLHFKKLSMFFLLKFSVVFLFLIMQHAKSLQLCLTFCDSTDHSSPSFFVYGILQVRKLEWVAMPSSGGSSWPRDWTHVSYVFCIGGFFTSSAIWEINVRIIILGWNFLSLDHKFYKSWLNIKFKQDRWFWVTGHTVGCYLGQCISNSKQ